MTKLIPHRLVRKSDENNEFYQKGRKEALEDIKDDKLRMKTFGTKALWFWKWQQILFEDHGIAIDIVAGGAIFEGDIEYTHGYNEISEPEIKKRFGDDCLETTKEKAKAQALIDFENFVPDEPSDNGNEEMIATANKFDWVKCPNCNKSFKTYSEVSWNGKFHLSCGQKIKLVNR